MEAPRPNSVLDFPPPSRSAAFSNVLAWVGAWLFLSGGTTLKGVAFGRPVLLELGQWGLAFIPLLLLILIGRSEWRDLSFVRRLHRLWPHLGERRTAVALAGSIAGLHFFAMLSRHYSFQSEWDISIYANACSNGMHSSMRNHLPLLADHFEPILYLFAPLCSSLNPIMVFLAAQCIAWFVGAWGIRKLALSSHWSPSLATIAMALYLLFSGIQTAAYYDFHPYALSLATIPWMLFAVLRSNYILLGLTALIHLSLKENTALFVAGLGVYLLLQERRKLGVPLLALGLTAFLVVMFYVFPMFRQGQETLYFAKYYGYLGSTFKEVLTTAILKPWVVLHEVLSPAKITYMLGILAPFAFIHFLRPLTLIPIAPAVAVSVLSNVPVMYSRNFHYEAEIYAWLFAAAVSFVQQDAAVERWKHWTKRAGMLNAVLPVMIWLGVMIGLYSGITPIGRISYYMPSRPQIELATTLDQLRREYRNCKVATIERLSPHLATVTELTMLDEHSLADVIIVAYPQGERLWIQNFDTISDQYTPLWKAGYTLENPIRTDKDFQVWTKPSIANCKVDLAQHKNWTAFFVNVRR